MKQLVIMNKDSINKLQEQELELLIEFDKACMAIGVSYTLSSGTLLGAVRHNGFIPWDDDIDVAMLREDYELFLAEGQNHLPAHLFVQTYETDEHYSGHFAKIRNIATDLVDLESAALGTKGGVWIDIFPLDRVSEYSVFRKIDDIMLSLLWLLKYSYSAKRERKYGKPARVIIKLLLNIPARFIGSAQRINRLEKVVRVKNNNNKLNKFTYGDNISNPCFLQRKNLMPVSLFFDTMQIRFEGQEFQSIRDYHTYLSVMYGDYLSIPPLEERVPPHSSLIVEYKP